MPQTQDSKQDTVHFTLEYWFHHSAIPKIVATFHLSMHVTMPTAIFSSQYNKRAWLNWVLRFGSLLKLCSQVFVQSSGHIKQHYTRSHKRNKQLQIEKLLRNYINAYTLQCLQRLHTLLIALLKTLPCFQRGIFQEGLHRLVGLSLMKSSVLFSRLSAEGTLCSLWRCFQQ